MKTLSMLASALPPILYANPMLVYQTACQLLLCITHHTWPRNPSYWYSRNAETAHIHCACEQRHSSHHKAHITKSTAQGRWLTQRRANSIAFVKRGSTLCTRPSQPAQCLKRMDEEQIQRRATGSPMTNGIVRTTRWWCEHHEATVARSQICLPALQDSALFSPPSVHNLGLRRRSWVRRHTQRGWPAEGGAA